MDSVAQARREALDMIIYADIYPMSYEEWIWATAVSRAIDDMAARDDENRRRKNAARQLKDIAKGIENNKKIGKFYMSDPELYAETELLLSRLGFNVQGSYFQFTNHIPMYQWIISWPVCVNH